jgi:hypothetical protein
MTLLLLLGFHETLEWGEVQEALQQIVWLS